MGIRATMANIPGTVLVVLEVSHKRDLANKKVLWYRCLCTACGSEKEIRKYSIHGLSKNGNQKSCGCLRRHYNAVAHCTKARPGDTDLQEYRIWSYVKTRCNNPNDKAYPSYGGRGIKMCPEWENDFSRFLADMGGMPSPKHSIDRIDNEKGYEPGNCRWATRLEQANNRRSNLTVTHEGKTLTITQWARETGINWNTLISRYRSGDRGDHLFRPVVSNKNKI